MRVRLIFELKNRGGWVPFHHQFLLAEFLEGVKANIGAEYKNYDRYNFSGLKGQTKVGKNGLHFYSNKVTLVFASPEKEFIDKMLKEVFSKKELSIGKLDLVPEYVEIEKEPTFEDHTKFICISPLVIAMPDTEIGASKQFINPPEDQFSDLLYESTMNRMEVAPEFENDDLAQFFKFQVDPDRKYLDRIRANEKKFSRIYPVYIAGDKQEVRGYTFPFTFYVDKRVQKFVFETGFGELTYKGFGMLDIANVDPIGRAQKYEF